MLRRALPFCCDRGRGRGRVRGLLRRVRSAGGGSNGPPPASNPAVDTRDANDASVRQQDNSLACPADIPMPQPDFAALSSSSSSSSISISSPTSTSTPSSSYLSQSYYTVVEYSHYSPAEILTLYTLTPTITTAPTNPGSYLGPDPYTISSDTPTPDWTTTASSSSSSTVQPSGYFPATTPEHWLSASGDLAGFAAADPRYFYVPEPEPDRRL
ncbi:hypothetical protein MBM_08898 [Drepanopeziza brunnea f. sp. 'multigermtubi' MB_m1]|uniref:Uncharacterized protein n=1 Tax=Marssonina brunnea f. sp. multigermtubi (strain MB_m1) TaxID=1072389 RepID=K1XKF0_MARBU|nr:uncharacterized protein MBM_08898 [Drepanopeziza brunnea f. sp. 'multigermtubi' MB_m1]EKD12944.1 hypothetical protein MBM_08898 [Drepanopeziza brunnea f. sp. 'multigermtubi' MB_m1]